MNDNKILIIIPAYNEEANILNVVNNIKKYKKTKLDYIVINDGSKDSTKKVLETNNINYIDLPFNMGIGAAVQTGYRYAYKNNYDICIQFDGDGQHDINYVDKLIKPITNGDADMVVGSRYIEDISEFKSTFARQLGIKCISIFIKLLSHKKLKDVTSGYRAVNKDIIKIFSDEYPQEYPEPITNYALLKNNYKVKEVGVNMYERASGKSSINFIKSIYYVFNVFMSILFINLKKYKKEEKDVIS